MRNKLLLTVIALAFCGLSVVQAQSPVKIAYADVDYILSQMPESRQVQSELQTHNKQLQSRLQAKYQEFQQKLQAYQQEAPNLADATRQERESELGRMEQEFEKFQQEAQSSVQKKTAELMRPLYTKVGDNIEIVAKEQGYTYVLNGNVGGVDVVLYADEGYDISDLVLKKMGVTPSQD